MPDPAPTKTPAAAPAAAVPPAPIPTPASAPAKATPTSPPEKTAKASTGAPITERAQSLFRKLSENTVEPAEPKKEPAAPAPTPAPAKTPEPEPEPDKPIKVSKGKAAKRPDLPIGQPAPTPAPVATPAPATPVADSANWEDDLIDEEKAALEDARYAEQRFPDKYKGHGERMEKFLRKHKEFLEKNPDVDDGDPEYKKLLAQRPELTFAQRREITESRIEERVKKSNSTELDEIRHELYVRDEEPKIADTSSRLFTKLAHEALPEEMKSVLKEKGLAALQKDYADEMDIAGTIIKAATDDAAELMRITRINPKTKRPLAKIAEDPSDPKFEQHERLAKIMDDVCEEFKSTGTEKELKRDGKWFVTREEWQQLQPAHRAQFWTFSNSAEHIQEVIDRAMSKVPGYIEKTIKLRHAELEKRGYKRHREAAPAPTPTPPAPIASTATPRSGPVPPASSPNNPPVSRGSLLAQKIAAGTSGT
jgi:hypothetical protein